MSDTSSVLQLAVQTGIFIRLEMNDSLNYGDDDQNPYEIFSVFAINRFQSGANRLHETNQIMYTGSAAQHSFCGRTITRRVVSI